MALGLLTTPGKILYSGVVDEQIMDSTVFSMLSFVYSSVCFLGLDVLLLDFWVCFFEN